MKNEGHGLSENVSIEKDGSILLGSHVVCDGFIKKKPITFFTHIHSDHIFALPRALKSYETEILVSIPTRALLVAIEGRHLLRRSNFTALNWGTPHKIQEDTITLHKSEHILGSSQILVEKEEEHRIVYTGDFNNDTQPLYADILVIDATYGTLRRNYEMADLVDEVLYLIRREINIGRPAYFFTWRGRLQRMMGVFRREGIDAPFISTPEEIELAKVYGKYEEKIENLISEDTMEAWEIMKAEDPYIAFYNTNARPRIAEKYLKIVATANDAPFPIYMPRKNYYRVAISDHADFLGIKKYIDESKPKLVVTDASRSPRNAPILAKAIKNDLNIEAIAMPSV